MERDQFARRITALIFEASEARYPFAASVLGALAAAMVDSADAEYALYQHVKPWTQQHKAELEARLGIAPAHEVAAVAIDQLDTLETQPSLLDDDDAIPAALRQSQEDTP